MAYQLKGPSAWGRSTSYTEYHRASKLRQCALSPDEATSPNTYLKLKKADS